MLSNDDLFEAVRLYCGITHTNELVVESCYLYCYAMKQLIVNQCSSSKAYEEILLEADRRARVSGFSTIKYWIENDIEIDEDEMPKPSYRPISFIKTSFLWALYYLKKDYTFHDAVREIISKGGDTQANAAIVGGLIGASKGMSSID